MSLIIQQAALGLRATGTRKEQDPGHKHLLASACFMFANAPLAKAGHITRLDSRVGE